MNPTIQQVRHGNKAAGDDAAKQAADKKVADAAAKAKVDAEAKALADAAAGDTAMSLEQVQDLIGKSIADGFAKHTPKDQPITLDAVKGLIESEFKKFAEDSKAISKENLKDFANGIIEKGFDNIRREKKNVIQGEDAKGSRGTNDAGDQDESALRGVPGTKTALGIEIPYALCKGNLPLHMEQLKNILMHRDQNHGIKESALSIGRQYDDHFWNGIKQFGAKSLTAAGTGTGAEFIPRMLSSELYRRLYLESQLSQGFLDSEIQMPTDPYDFPLQTTDPTFYLNTTENVEGDASDVGTANFTLTCKTMMALVQYSYKVDEDSIIPVLPILQERLARAAARALENALINGDTTGTHQDSDITNSKDVAKAWKGFRKLSLAVTALKSDLSTGGISRANLLSVLKLLGKWGVRTQDILWVFGPKGWNSILGLDEVVNFYQRGAVGSFINGGPSPAPWGGKIVVSDQCRENLNASGVFDNTTTTKGSLLAINKSGFVFGSRREFMVEAFRNIRSQTHDIVASFRKAFSPVEVPSATITTCAAGYNYTA